MPDFRKEIVIQEDGTATYRSIGVIAAKEGQPERTRVLETKRVDAAELFGETGELFLWPQYCRFTRQEKNVSVFLIEESPAKRTVQWNTRSSYFLEMKKRLRESGMRRLWKMDESEFERYLNNQRRFELAFPYLIKCYRFSGNAFDSLSLWYRTKPLRTERDGLLDANLPNKNVDSRIVCLPKSEIIVSGQHFGEMVEQIDKVFWGSVWNSDWLSCFTKTGERIPEIASPWEWEQYSKTHSPLDMTKLPWLDPERSVGQELRTLLVGNNKTETPSGERFFLSLMNRLQAADEWDGKPKQTDALMRVSPAENLQIFNQLLRIGDVLEFTDSVFDQAPIGTQGKIEWFSTVTNGMRFVKLDVIEEPLPLIVHHKLHSAVRLIKQQQIDDVIMGNNIRLEPKMFCRFTDRQEWPNHSDCFYEIRQVQRGSQGEIRVKLKDEQFFLVIGEQDQLFTGISIREAELPLINGLYLDVPELTLRDGTVIRVGDTLWTLAGGLQKNVVQCLIGVRHRSLGRGIRTTTGQNIEIEEADGTLSKNLALATAEPILSVTAGDITLPIGVFVKKNTGVIEQILEFSPRFQNGLQYVKFDQSEWCLLSERENTFSENLTVIAPIRSTTTRVFFDTDVIHTGEHYFDETTRRIFTVRSFDQPEAGTILANAAYPLIKQFIRVPTLKRVLFTQGWNGLNLKRGMRVRLREDIKDFKANKRLTISHILLGSEGLPATMVFTNGLGFDLTEKNARYFEIRRRKRNRFVWKALAETSTDEKTPDLNTRLEVGMQVRYLGGDGGTNFRSNGTEELAKMSEIVLTSFRSSQNKWLCRFDRDIHGLHTNYNEFQEYRYQWICAEFLKPSGEFDIKQLGLKRCFEPPKNMRRTCFGTPFGTLIDNDKNGNEIRIGDRVKTNRLDPYATFLAVSLQEAGYLFTVVHFGNNDFGKWLYLLADRSFERVPPSSIAGFNSLPPKLKQDDEWLSRITFALAIECEVVK